MRELGLFERARSRPRRRRARPFPTRPFCPSPPGHLHHEDLARAQYQGECASSPRSQRRAPPRSQCQSRSPPASRALLSPAPRARRARARARGRRRYRRAPRGSRPAPQAPRQRRQAEGPRRRSVGGHAGGRARGGSEDASHDGVFLKHAPRSPRVGAEHAEAARRGARIREVRDAAHKAHASRLSRRRARSVASARPARKPWGNARRESSRRKARSRDAFAAARTLATPSPEADFVPKLAPGTMWDMLVERCAARELGTRAAEWRESWVYETIHHERAFTRRASRSAVHAARQIRSTATPRRPPGTSSTAVSPFRAAYGY